MLLFSAARAAAAAKLSVITQSESSAEKKGEYYAKFAIKYQVYDMVNDGDAARLRLPSAFIYVYLSL